MSTSEKSPEQTVAAFEAQSERFETPSGDGVMVWRRWRSRSPAPGAKPVVMLHGGSGSWRHWILNIEPLRRDRDVWTPDIPGFGDSAAPPEPVNFASVARIITAGLKEMIPGDQPLDLVGFSFGSHTIQYVAEALGNRVGTAVLVTAHMLGPMLAQPGHMLERWRDLDDEAERVRVLKRNLGALMLAHEATMDPMALHIYATDVVRARIRPVKFINQRDYTLIERLKCRVAGIAGELDPLGIPTPAAQGEALIKARPDARFHLVRNAGHWVSYEAPDEFNATLRGFLG